MTEDPCKNRTPATEADSQSDEIGDATPRGGPVVLAEYDPLWPEQFTHESTRIGHVLGGTALRIEHVGSTSVPGLAAKPTIDILLEVADSSKESTFLPALGSIGYKLYIREPDWFEHRLLKGPDMDVNLHVFTVGCPEVDRMLRFRDQLRSSQSDRQRYEAKKRELASRDWAYIQNYADAKSDVIEEMIAKSNKNSG